jgi:ABC-type Zn uptake system ZnuABC Zn-binding protein ZnuA/ABC-type Mn2+/Zn2+ transport system permease subunit
VLESLDLPFVQRGLAEVALLAVGAGLIGTWIVLRGLAFHSHAVGTAAFPGLVLADGLGFAAALGALGAAVAFVVALPLLTRRRADDGGAEVGLVLVGMLALGVILASDVFESSAAVDNLLFGSLLLIDDGELALAGALSAVAVAATVLLGRHWLAHGFDAGGETRPRPWVEPALLALVALGTASAVTALGALLVTALFVVPAATTRPWTSRMRSWQIATIALCLAEGVAGVLLSVELNAPPGATIAVLAGVVFAIGGLAAHARRTGGGRALARWATVGLVAALLAGCGSDEEDDAASVVATTPVAGDLAGEVAGDAIEVRTLLAAGTDPHDYEPRPDDIEALAEADLIVANGGDLDAWIDDALEDSGGEGDVLVLGDEIEYRREVDGEFDPHWWHDPRNVESVAPVIADALVDLDPEAAGEIRRGEKRLSLLARSTDTAVEGCLSAVPDADRKLVTDHDAFGYFADRYGFEVVGTVIPALTTAAQASAGELAELRETIEREGVKAVFPESSVTTDVAQAIADEAGATVGDDLFGDSLGDEGSSGGSWQAAESANANAIVSGLSGPSKICEGLP